MLMYDYLMADSNVLSQKHTNSSLFSIPGFFIGFGNKGSSDSDSVRSPTSPLDFRVLYSLRNPFSLKSAGSSSHGNKKKWDCSKEGLGIVNSLVDETKETSEVLGSLKRKNIIFGPQVKTNIANSSKLFCDSDNYPIKSQPSQRNYITRPFSETLTLSPQLQADRGNDVFGSVELPLESEPLENIAPCLLDSSRASLQIGSIPNLRFKRLHSENITIRSSSSDLGTKVENSLGIRPSSLPVTIDFTHQYASPISARDIELSEDYTCIISHGPTPKKTHIFGDCILQCHTNELNNFDEGKLGIESPLVAKHRDGLTSYHSDEILRLSYTCKKNLAGEEIYMCRGKKAFCSFDCHSEKTFAEEETENTYNNSAGSSPESYTEGLFFLGMDCQDM